MNKDKQSIFLITIKLLLVLLLLIFTLSCLYYFWLVIGFFGYDGREPYAGAVLGEVAGHFQLGLEYTHHFPKDEKEFLEMLEIVKQIDPEYGKPRYKRNLHYRLIEDKGDEILFLIIVDSTKNIKFITYGGTINPGLGKAKKDEKGEWHTTIEWFYRNYSIEDSLEKKF